MIKWNFNHMFWYLWCSIDKPCVYTWKSIQERTVSIWSADDHF